MDMKCWKYPSGDQAETRWKLEGLSHVQFVGEDFGNFRILRMTYSGKESKSDFPLVAARRYGSSLNVKKGLVVGEQYKRRAARRSS
ncbi:hypothetical protein Tco_0887675 [Tanacetum coccineum]